VVDFTGNARNARKTAWGECALDLSRRVSLWRQKRERVFFVEAVQMSVDGGTKKQGRLMVGEKLPGDKSADHIYSGDTEEAYFAKARLPGMNDPKGGGGGRIKKS